MSYNPDKLGCPEVVEVSCPICWDVREVRVTTANPDPLDEPCAECREHEVEYCDAWYSEGL